MANGVLLLLMVVVVVVVGGAVADMNMLMLGCSMSRFSNGSLSIMERCCDNSVIEVRQGRGVMSQVSFLTGSNTWAV